MKTKRVCTMFILFGLLLFLYRWFFWDIIDIITPFLIWIPSIAFIFATVIFLIYSVVYATKNAKYIKQRAFFPLIIIVASILLALFFPFTKIILNLDFKLNYDARNEVVAMIENGELKPDSSNENLITLPKKYKGLSKGGGEVMIESFFDHDAYMFFTFGGILDNYSGFIYDPSYEALLELGSEYLEVEQLSESWYYCSSK